MIGHIKRFPYFYICLGFILLCLGTLNNLPYGDDNTFIFDSYLKGVESLTSYWNPYSLNFKSWPLPYTVITVFLRAFEEPVIPFRIFNLLLHIANSFLVLKVLSFLKPAASKTERLLIFSLFLFHPISLITLNWIFQIKTLLCVFFSLLTLIFFESLKKKPKVYALPALISFFLALTSKIACVLLPLYFIAGKKSYKNKPIFYSLAASLLSLSLIYGLINIKGINSFFKEKELSQKTVTEYAQDPVKVVEGPKPVPKNYYFIDLQEQLRESAASLKNQFSRFENIRLKVILSLFTFGRYIGSSLGLNRFAIVYEPNWASLAPAVIFPFIIATFAFFCFLVSKERLKELGLLCIFFLPISGMFYVPYMKFSYVADHWFYPALPFLLCFFIIARSKKAQLGLSVLVFSQFAFLSYNFSSTSKITNMSLDLYQNPFIYGYMIQGAEKSGDYKLAYQLVDEYTKRVGRETELSVKTKLRLNIESLHNSRLSEDLQRFLNYSIINEEYGTSLLFLKDHGEHLSPRLVDLYLLLTTGASGRAGQREGILLREVFQEQ